jgi:hypothetical protein
MLYRMLKLEGSEVKVETVELVALEGQVVLEEPVVQEG